MSPRLRPCRCCTRPTPTPYCPACHWHNVTHARLVAGTIRELWGEDGLRPYQATLRATRLSARPTTSRKTA
jgi:hypothetical protein